MPAWLLKLLLTLVGPKAMKMGAKGVAKAAYGSKAFWPVATTGGFLGITGLSEGGRTKEREASAEEMELQKFLAESGIAAKRMAVAESRKSTKKYMAYLTEEKREDRREARDVAAMQAFSQSQDRQMALLMQAVQALSAHPTGGNTPAPGGGMLGLLRRGGG